MGVRTLVGTADGTPAAAMYDSVTGTMFGTIFEGDDAADQVEGFIDWLGREPYVLLAEKIGLDASMIPDPTRDAADARTWPDSGLSALLAYWHRERRGSVEA